MLTQSQKDLILSTVPILKENGTLLTRYFYERMLGKEPQLKEVFNVDHQKTGKQAQALANAVLAYAENINDPSCLMPIIEMICHKHVSLNIQAPDYNIVGEHLLCSISEVLQIPLEHELIQAWKIAYQQLADIFIQTEQEIYNKTGWLGWREFKIVEKVIESDEITSFYLQPTDNQSLPNYQAGQYISLRVFIPELGYKQPRQYSLSDCAGKSYFRISVKKEQPSAKVQGYVSNTLHQLGINDCVELSAPTGNFFLANPYKTNVFISGGVGLTPMLAMLNQLLTNQEYKYDIHFIHTTRNAQVHAMKEQLKTLASEHPNLKLHVAYEHPQKTDILGQDYHQAGYLKLNTDLVPPQADYYLCGPAPFMQAQHQALVELGINPKQIYSEAFSAGGVKL